MRIVQSIIFICMTYFLMILPDYSLFAVILCIWIILIVYNFTHFSLVICHFLIYFPDKCTVRSHIKSIQKSLYS